MIEIFDKTLVCQDLLIKVNLNKLNINILGFNLFNGNDIQIRKVQYILPKILANT